MEQEKIKNREIKFRAKTVAGNRWVYGDLITKPIHYDCVILENGVINHSVIPETVGQYTGLKDKNGKDIYEGDIVKWDDCSKGEYWRVAKVVIDPDIQFRIIKNTLYPLSTPFPDTFHFGSFIYGGKDLEVIGNAFENKDIIL